MAGDPEVAKRLRLARERAGFETAQEAVDEFGLEYGTYLHHENGTRTISLENAARYAEMYDVSLSWLATGAGGMDDSPRGDSLAGLSPDARRQVLNLISLLKRK